MVALVSLQLPDCTQCVIPLCNTLCLCNIGMPEALSQQTRLETTGPYQLLDAPIMKL